jgi:hypothetical protein
MIPKTGFSQKTRRMWAAMMCKDKSPGCPPAWVSESEVFDFWYQAVKAGGTGKGNGAAAPLASPHASSGVVLYDGNDPPF